jgi:hypothetical protein
MRIPSLLFASLLSLLPVLACAQQQLPAVTVVGQADYTGVWRADQTANAKLERDMRKKMRKKMKQAMGAQSRPPSGPPGSGGGPPSSGGPGGMPPGGGPPGGGPPGGMPPDAPRMPEPSTFGAIRPEMDFALPLQGDLEIVSDAARVRIGQAGTELTELAFGKGATELANGGSRAFADWEDKKLVIEINTEDGVQVTHTYSLESQGERMRIQTRVAGATVPIPGGMEMERLYTRAPQ